MLEQCSKMQSVNFRSKCAIQFRQTALVVRGKRYRNIIPAMQNNQTTQITGLNSDVDALKRGQIPFFVERPRNTTYVVVLKVRFAGTITRFESQLAGAGVATCNPPVNGTFAAESNITLTVTGANAATRDLNASLYFTRV